MLIIIQPQQQKLLKNSGIRASICLGFHPNDVRNINDIEQEYLQNKKYR